MELVTPHLKSVLKTYQHSATKSLQGPGLSLVAAESEDLKPLPVVSALHPILSAPDPGRGERCETLLEGEAISCFVVGGEKRLCLPQILTSVLTDFSLDQINRICDELQIYCSRCTPEQLHELKVTGILPKNAPSCGLITKTDAERLCSALLHKSSRQTAHAVKNSFQFRVYHECFGKCKGICVPELYTHKDAGCIECIECQGLFSPQKFVCHVHRELENRTCHWGFDSSNWRAYVLVCKDQLDENKCNKILDELKEEYERMCLQAAENPLKHKMSDSASRRAEAEAPSKKPKMEEIYGAYAYAMDPYLQAAAFYERCRSFSAFRPWPKFLAREPPVLQHPERVVRLKDSARFERSFQPNVALKPLTPPGSDEITSSTSPPPERAAPPDCELSTDTEEEEVKEPRSPHSPHSPHSPQRSQDESARRRVPRDDSDRRLARAEKRLEMALESLREKEAIIARQKERLEASELTVRRQRLQLSEREAVISRQAALLGESETEKREEAPPQRDETAAE